MRGFSEELEGLREADLLRGVRTFPEGVVDFSSNDYLGLSRHEELKAAAVEAVEKYGTGSRASRLVCGTLVPHLALEERLAEWKGAEACLTFSSGYAAAVGTLSGLLSKGDVVVMDKWCHASLIDGARLSGATLRTYRHNDVDRLRDLLTKVRGMVSRDARVLVVTEAVFSMDGDVAPLEEIAETCEEYGALLMVDEAHATGTRGARGAGRVEELGLGSRIPLVMGTLSKALGGAGGYLCASRSVVDVLVNRARSFIYSTAPPPAMAAAAMAAVEVCDSEEGASIRKRLWGNVRQFSPKADSPISPVIVGENAAALKKAKELLSAGYLVAAIRYPTVPRGTARLRVVVTAAHTAAEIDSLKKALG